MTPELLRLVWLGLRSDKQQQLLASLNKADKLKVHNEGIQLEALHQIVMNALDTFQPQA